MKRRKGKERSEKGGGESVRVSTCVGSRGGGACFVERGGGERRECEVELECLSADPPMAVRAWLVRGSDALTLVLFGPKTVTCKLPPFKAVQIPNTKG
jgi:hypothetical protein